MLFCVLEQRTKKKGGIKKACMACMEGEEGLEVAKEDRREELASVEEEEDNLGIVMRMEKWLRELCYQFCGNFLSIW